MGGGRKALAEPMNGAAFLGLNVDPEAGSKRGA